MSVTLKDGLGSLFGAATNVAADGSGAKVPRYVGDAGSTIDGGGTIAVDNTAQDVFAAKSDRRYLFIKNVDKTNQYDLWIDFGADAVEDQPSILLQFGESFVMEAGFVETRRVSIIGAHAGTPFAAKEA